MMMMMMMMTFDCALSSTLYVVHKQNFFFSSAVICRKRSSRQLIPRCSVTSLVMYVFFSIAYSSATAAAAVMFLPDQQSTSRMLKASFNRSPSSIGVYPAPGLGAIFGTGNHNP